MKILYMDGSKNKGPKMDGYKMENPIEMDPFWGENPPFLETSTSC